MVRLSQLTTDPEWQALWSSLDPKLNITGVDNVLQQIRRSGATCVLIEEEYLDQDFTASYSAFYATVFKRHIKLCVRLHFFKVDIKLLIDDVNAQTSALELEETAKENYLGFIVARPLSHAPLGRVVLAAPIGPLNTDVELLVYADYEAHVLGANLKVRGIALTQQDARVGA
jgi:hypothetical protein